MEKEGEDREGRVFMRAGGDVYILGICILCAFLGALGGLVGQLGRR